MPTRDSVLFPGQAMPLRVGRSKSVAAIEKAVAKNSWVLLLAQKSDKLRGAVNVGDLYEVGTLAKIEKVRGDAKNGYQVVVRGSSRFKVDSLVEEEGVILASGHALEDIVDLDAVTSDMLLKSLKTIGKEILNLLPTDTSQVAELIDGITDLAYLSYLCAAHLEIPSNQKQEILEKVSLKDRTLELLQLLHKQKSSLEIRGEIQEKLSHRVGKLQREAFLREQLKTIREELGEESSGPGNADYREKVNQAGMPEDVKKAALEEVARLESIGNNSPETHVIRNYLDLLTSLPWNKSSDSEIDLKKAREALEADHYGLPKIKQRIIQHLAVMKLRKHTQKGSILLLVGPPGVGKTSLGQSIAKALGRKFVRGSLGGVRDDAEIRGHRRTYIGAMPGRIIQAIKRAGENNPVFMLDEIDKLGRGYGGDPAAALLEALDPEQNGSFLDHYLDVPFDLSKVFFIATANSLDSIPAPLLDRMEVIEVAGYTTAEKLHIAKNHLIPKQLVEHGVEASQLELSDESVLRLITHHTREAGVRELQRVIAQICRASTEKVIERTLPGAIRIEQKDLEELVGPERYVHEVAELMAPAGVVTGLAWTPQGGEILFIEASLMPGNGKLTLTGQLGEVMKESAQIALSLVRSQLPMSVPGFEYDKRDLHIHVPAGAIPKDGPSAGITMLTTIASLFTGRRVDPQLAMTGEVTLRGAVMPVGGIKEKVLAAHRAGIRRIILSKRNQKDLRDVPDEVKAQMKFDFVETAAEVLRLALGVELTPLPLGSAPVVPNSTAVA